MTRLYGRLQSDTRKTDATVGANESISCRLTWGSANNPRVAVVVAINWNKDHQYPSMYINIPDNVKVNMFRSGKLVYKRRPN